MLAGSHIIGQFGRGWKTYRILHWPFTTKSTTTSLVTTIFASWINSISLPNKVHQCGADYRSPDCSGVNPLELLHEHGSIPNPLHFLQHHRSNNDPLTIWRLIVVVEEHHWQMFLLLLKSHHKTYLYQFLFLCTVHMLILPCRYI